MKDYRIGQRVTYKVDDFDGSFSTECMVVDVKDGYAIAVEINEPEPLRLMIDAYTDYMFKAIA